ncbi:hypothetical protein ACSSS7_002733 [Eimeria intestinalis]
MAPRAQKALFLLVVCAAAVLSVTAVQLEDADDLDLPMEPEVSSFSEMDADALVDKLDDEEDAMADNEYDGDLNEEDQEEADAEAAPSFIEGEDEEAEEDEFDLAGMSDDDAQAIMEMLTPEEREAFSQMLAEHKNTDSFRENEL